MNIFKLTNFKINNKIIPAITLFLSWVIVAYGQPAWSPFMGVVASLVGFALFWSALFNFKKLKERFWISTFWFMAVEAIHLSWMTASKYQGSYIYIVYLCMLFLLGLQFGLLNLFMKPAEELTFSRIGFIAGFWVWMEWIKLFFICGFPFNPVGLTLTSTLWGMQGASLFGIYGLSFWVLITNLFAYKCLFCFSKKRLLFFILISTTPYLFGCLHLQLHQKKIGRSSTLSAVLVQTALDPAKKTGFRGYENMLPPIDQWGLIYESLSQHQDMNVELIVLPERTVPLSHNTPFYSRSGVEKLVKHYLGEKGVEAMPQLEIGQAYVDNLYLSQTLANFFKAQVIVGLEHVQSQSQNHFLGNASAFHFSPNKPYQLYHKQILLPLVEYIPYEWCKKLARRYNIYGWYEPGKEAVVFEGEHKISPSICMEEMFSFVVRKNKLKGGEVFVNITNDVWYPDSKLPKQHFDHGILRAVENGVPLLRSCNTGVTGAVDATGRLVGALRGPGGSFQWERGALHLEVPQYHYQTFYSVWGDSLILSLSALLIISFYLKRYKIKEKYKSFAFSNIILTKKEL